MTQDTQTLVQPEDAGVTDIDPDDRPYAYTDAWAQQMEDAVRRQKALTPQMRRAAEEQRQAERDDFAGLREDVRLIGDMLMDVSNRLAAIERAVTDTGAQARGSWAQRTGAAQG